MDIDHLREFVYLAETLNFSITSQHFYLSQSVISKHISALEDSLGVKLFERTGRSVHLTPQGQMFYQDANVVLNDYDNALANIEASKRQAEMVLRVGYLRNACQPFIPTFTRFIEEAHPEIRLELTCMEYGELIKAHWSHEVDVIMSINLDPEAVAVCDFGYIYSDRFYAVVGKQHPLAAEMDGISSECLEKRGLLLPKPRDYPGFQQFFSRFLPENVNRDRTVTYGDIDTMIMRLENEDLIGFSSGHNIPAFGGKIAFIPLLDVDTRYDICAMWLKSMNAKLVGVTLEAVAVCRDYMRTWHD